jgi:hypothetical protein
LARRLDAFAAGRKGFLSALSDEKTPRPKRDECEWKKKWEFITNECDSG